MSPRRPRLLAATLPLLALSLSLHATTVHGAEGGDPDSLVGEIKLPAGFTLTPVAQVQAWGVFSFYGDEAEDPPATYGDPQLHGVALRRARLGLRSSWKGLLGIGVVGGWDNRYDATEDRSDTPELLEGWLAVTPAPFFEARIGQQRTPFGRQGMASSFALALWDRSMAAEHMGFSYDPGLVFQGTVGPDSAEEARPIALKYAAGLFTGSDWRGQTHPEARVNGRLRVDLLRDWDDRESHFGGPGPALSVGGSAAHEWGLEAETGTLGVDLGFRVWRISLQGEVFWQKATPTFSTEGIPSLLSERKSLGGYAQLGVMAIPNTLEIAARLDSYDDNTALDDGGDRMDLAFGANIFLFEQHLKIQADYVHRMEKTEGTETPNDSLIFALQGSL